MDTAFEVAGIAAAQFCLGGGLLVALPAPEPIDPAMLAEATDEAERLAAAQGIAGAAKTPFVLARIAELTAGASIVSNIGLVSNNARVAADIAIALLATA